MHSSNIWKLVDRNKRMKRVQSGGPLRHLVFSRPIEYTQYFIDTKNDAKSKFILSINCKKKEILWENKSNANRYANTILNAQNKQR